MSARNDNKICTDLIDLMLGEKIGSGISREVYVLRTNERYVAKLETSKGDYFSNVREWTIWNAAFGIDWARKWLAKPYFISENGRVLIMERTTFFNQKKEWPSKLPVWLTDFKPENYGWGCESGNFICHDYANDIVIGNGFQNRLRNIKWRTREV